MIIPRSLYLPLCICAGLLSIARFTDPPDGNTGAPGESICTSCHNPGNPNGYTGSVNITGLPAQTMSGQVYPLTVIVNNPDLTAVRGGFQMVALDENNQNAGSFSSPGPSSKVSNSGGRSYHEHNPGKNFSGSPQISWTVNWTAPSVQGNEQVTFYAAGLIANGNNNTFGDLVVATDISTQVEGNAPPLIVTITNSTDPSCFGVNDGSATASASGGNPPYDFNWSTGGTQPTEINMPAGMHTVTVFDQSGSSSQAMVTLVAPPPLNTNITVINTVTCPNGSDGTIQADVMGGVLPYNYFWSNGNTGSIISDLRSGIYSVTVEDGNGCLDIQDIFLDEPDAISYTINTNDILCFGESNGIGEILNVQGGNPGSYQFSWSDGFVELGSESRRNDLFAGSYSITITDQENCSTVTSLLIGGPDSLNIMAYIQEVRCHNEENGAIEIEITGGTNPYNIMWGNGSSSSMQKDLSPGEYSVTVTDLNGCITERSFTLVNPDSIILSLDTLINSQCGEPSGIIQTSASGGYSPFHYLWSNGDTLPTADTLLPGMYFVTVTDSLGCTASDTFDIIVSDEIGPEIIADDITVFLDTTGVYIVEEKDLSYVVSDECSDTIILNLSLPVVTCNDLNDTITGMIEAFDQIGNSSKRIFRINVVDSILPVWTELPVDLEEITCDGIIWYDPVISGKDNCDSVTLRQVKGPLLPDSIGIGSYDFEFELIDLNGNTISYSWTVVVKASNLSGDLTLRDPSCFGGNNGAVTFLPDDPELVNSIQLIPEADPDSLYAGTYRLIVMDTLGCQASFSFTINDPNRITLTDTLITPVSGGGASDGAILINLEGGTSPYRLSWYIGAPQNGGSIIATDVLEITGLAVGEYYLIVSDANGCEEIFSFVITTATWITDNIRVQYKLFPNPTSGRIFIDSDQEVVSVNVYQQDGTTCLVDMIFKEKTIDLESFPVGFYYVVIEWANGQTSIDRIAIIR